MNATPETYTLLIYPSREMLIARVLPGDQLEHPAWVTYEMTPQGIRLNFNPVTLFSDEAIVDGKQARALAVFEYTPTNELTKSYTQLIAQLRAAKSGLIVPPAPGAIPTPPAGRGPGGIVVPGATASGTRS